MINYHYKAHRKTLGSQIGTGAIAVFISLVASLTYSLDRPVTNTGDAGLGSLRQAVADARPGDRIVFDIPGDGPHLFSMQSQINIETSNIEIDGYSQRGSQAATETVPADLHIIIDGSNAENAFGFSLEAHNVVIKGLIIQNFISADGDVSGIIVNGNNNTITGSYIGTDGIQPASNNIGIMIMGSNNRIGGPTAADRMIISGNETAGIEIYSTHNRITNCYIGTNNLGTQAIANGDGISIAAGDHNTIRDSVISGNNFNGLNIDVNGGTNTNRNRIFRTLIGTDLTGRHPLPNQRAGILFTSGNIAENNYLNVNDNHVESSVIAFNGRAGINNHEGTALGNGNLFSENAIHSNGDTAIFLQNTGNRNQAAPDISSATSYVTHIRLSGFFTGLANARYRLEFFMNEMDRNLNGITEGKHYIGFITAETDAAGHGNFENIEFPTIGISGHLVSATAINENTGDTSEYSHNKHMVQRGRHI